MGLLGCIRKPKKSYQINPPLSSWINRKNFMSSACLLLSELDVTLPKIFVIWHMSSWHLYKLSDVTNVRWHTFVQGILVSTEKALTTEIKARVANLYNITFKRKTLKNNFQVGDLTSFYQNWMWIFPLAKYKEMLAKFNFSF